MALTQRSTRSAAESTPIRPVRKYEGVYLGVVRDNKDVQRMGRLRVWIDVLGSDPDDENGWVTASYCSPFAGASDYEAVKGGIGGEGRPENAQVSYGFWAVPPDINNSVIIMFINGDPSRAIWMGCLYQQKINRMVPGIPHGNTHGEADEAGGGPRSDERRPTTEHNRRTKAVFKEEMKRPEIDLLNGTAGISRGLKTQGVIRDYVRGMTDSGARRDSPSEVYGWLTPGPLLDDIAGSEERVGRHGGSQYVMDDGEGREKIRIRTRSGAQILLDESNGLVYISNRDGTAWVHMDEAGRIDVYGAENISIRGERDLTIRADRDLIMEAGRDISLKANRDWKEKTDGALKDQEAVPEEGGNIRIHANQHLDMIASNDHRVTINGNLHLQVGNDRNTIIGRDDNTQVDRNSYLTVNREDYRIAVNRDYLNTAGGNSEQFAGNDMKLQAVNDIEQFAFQGKMDIGSQLNMSLKTKKGDFSAIAQDAKGNMSLKSNNNSNQILMTNPKFTMATVGNLVNIAREGWENFTSSEVGVNSNGDITVQGSPLDGGCLDLSGIGVSVKFDGRKIEMDAVDEIASKIQNRFDKFGNKIETSVSNVQNKLDAIEDAVNEVSNWAGEYVAEIYAAIEAFNLSDLFPSFVLPFPVLPQFPSFRLPALRLPALNLPNFPFNFCVDVGPLVRIDGFNPFAGGLFGTIGIDLNGWTRSNIGGWFGRQRANLRRSVASFNIGAQVRSQARDAIRDIRGNVTQLRRSLSNLASVSVVLSSKGDYLRDYSIGIRGFEQNLDRYRIAVAGIPGADDGLPELQNQMGAHARTMEQLVKIVDQDPGAIEGADFSQLEDMARFMRDLELDLIEIGEEQPRAV